MSDKDKLSTEELGLALISAFEQERITLRIERNDRILRADEFNRKIDLANRAFDQIRRLILATDLEIAEEQYMAIVMDLYERIEELEGKAGNTTGEVRGLDRAMLGQVNRCLETLEDFIDLPDIQAHGEEFYADIYGALFKFRELLQAQPLSVTREEVSRVWNKIYDQEWCTEDLVDWLAAIGVEVTK